MNGMKNILAVIGYNMIKEIITLLAATLVFLPLFLVISMLFSIIEAIGKLTGSHILLILLVVIFISTLRSVII